jgi:soluble lytic murein transglycosylase-like protein
MNRWLIIVAVVSLIAILKRSTVWQLPGAGEPWRDLFAENEARFNLPRNLLARVAQQESSYRPDVVSPAGAQGLMQIIPRWHPGIDDPDTPEIEDPFNPEAAIGYAGAYLRRLHDRFGTWSEALAAYNWGQGNLARQGFANAPEETRNYVEAIAGDLGLV